MDMKKIFWSIFVIFFGFFSISCTTKNTGDTILEEANIVRIIGKNNRKIFSQSMGYKISENLILTSAHSLNDENLQYLINDEKYTILEKNLNEDIAFLGKNLAEKIPENFLKKGIVGEKIFSFVERDGKKIKLE